MATKKATVKKDSGTEVNFDFEDSVPEKFVFQLGEHHAGRTLGCGVSVNKNAQVILTGTREEISGLGRILTRFYAAEVVTEE